MPLEKCIQADRSITSVPVFLSGCWVAAAVTCQWKRSQTTVSCKTFRSSHLIWWKRRWSCVLGRLVEKKSDSITPRWKVSRSLLREYNLSLTIYLSGFVSLFYQMGLSLWSPLKKMFIGQFICFKGMMLELTQGLNTFGFGTFCPSCRKCMITGSICLSGFASCSIVGSLSVCDWWDEENDSRRRKRFER